MENLCQLAGKLNILLSTHPAFSSAAEVALIQHGPGNVIAAWRSGKNIPPLLILINLDCENASFVHFPARKYSAGRDLLTSEMCQFLPDDNGQKFYLAPGEGRCIAFDEFELPGSLPKRTTEKLSLMAAAMAQNAALNFTTLANAAKADGNALCADPETFAEHISGIIPAPVSHWHFPQDTNRNVIIPPGDLLLVHSAEPFITELVLHDEIITRAICLQQKSGKFFALLRIPGKRKDQPENATLNITVFNENKVIRQHGTVTLLPEAAKRQIRLSGKCSEADDRFVFGSNRNSSYAMFSARWGELTSKYDAILAVNSNPEYPDDRHVLFTRCRAWLVIDGFSQELTAKTMENYSAHPGNRAKWVFLVPDGHGGKCTLSVEFKMALDKDAVELKFSRELRHDGITPSATLILRPDLENRVNHTLTRAYNGAEHNFPSSVTAKENGFDFAPGNKVLKMRISAGKFHREPEWHYMVDLPRERYYGMDDKTDLFSPGYFAIPLDQGESVTLTATTEESAVSGAVYPPSDFPDALPPEALAADALNRFIVKRDDLSTVIAGYPWFLDWGRDTLIVLRGLVKFPEFQNKSAEIIRRFAAFEKSGTIPNMICGGNDSNRDTSDAPLYLIIAVRDYIAATGDKEFLNCKCGNRTLHQILHSIIYHYQQGTYNGITMDSDSGLIFSPSHFSWMDTNYPAGTPREGYPVEIQSLWFAALEFLGEKQLAAKVRRSIEKYYFTGHIPADCLHCSPGIAARDAVPDDHLRCNILSAITSGAVTAPEKQMQILNAAARLLVPGAIRTLDDAEVCYALPVSHNGQLLNNPNYPYQGFYRGPEDTGRKPAYHNGTAWCWPFPAYCEALYMMGKEKSRKRALAILMSAANWMENGIIGELPEILDGNVPHRDGGCPAQAWSVSEFFRVLKILKKE